MIKSSIFFERNLICPTNYTDLKTYFA